MPATPARPNFLVFLTDQQRADHLSCMGNRVLRTPNIDRIAQAPGGCIFDGHYVNNPVCAPSRSTLFTGLTPRSHGVRAVGIQLDPRVPTITAALAQNGYRTHNVGKIHLGTFGLPNGADPQTLNPADYPEARHFWDQGIHTRLPADYYGLQTTEVAIGHGWNVHGDYRRWVLEQDPAAAKYFSKPGLHLRPPTGADQCLPWAIPADLHHSSWCATRTIDFLEKHTRDNTAQPFFCFCSFPDPHHPYTPPAPWADLYKPADVELPRARREGELDRMPPHYNTIRHGNLLLSGRAHKTNIPDDHLRELIALTYGMIGLIDHNVGRVLDALTRLHLDENTVVLFTSDHGDLMGDHGLLNKGPFLYRGLTRVPLLARIPPQVPVAFPAAPTTAFPAAAVSSAPAAEPSGPRRIASLTGHLDFAPTILHLAQVPIPEGFTPPEVESPKQAPAWPGMSLAPLIAGQSTALPRPNRALTEFDEDYLGDRLRSLVTPDYRVTLYPGRPYGELFDLQVDPDELHNRWDDPAAHPLKMDALATLAAELARTDMPLPRRYCHA